MSIEVDEMLLPTPKDYNKELKYRHKFIEEKLLQCYADEIVDIIVKLISENRVGITDVENTIVWELQKT